jgi:thiol-disulfide isomerase/thioredoxin
MANKAKKTTTKKKVEKVKKIEEVEELEEEEEDYEEEKKERKEKKSSKDSLNIKPILITIICIAAFVGLSFILPNGKEENNKNETAEEYKVSEWVKDVKDKTVVTVLASTTCPHCQAYKPTITKLARDNNFVLYFFEVDSLTTDEQNIVTSTFDLTNFEGAVPFTFIVKNGKVVSDTVGFSTEEETVKFLKTNGIIK